VVFCDGPVTYMLGRRYSVESLQQATRNLSEIVERTQVQRLVLDHHLLRELKWKERQQNLPACKTISWRPEEGGYTGDSSGSPPERKILSAVSR